MTAAEILAGCGDLVPVEKVLQLDTRWGNAQSLARATREGRGPAGRVLLSPTRPRAVGEGGEDVSDLTLCPVTIGEARAWITKVHRHHPAPVSALFAVACEQEGEIVGVATVGRPSARMLADGYTAEVTRVATNGTHNACSILYGAAWRACRALGYRRLVTYTLPEEGGASLRASGWTLVGKAGGGSWDREDRPRIDKAPTQEKFKWERAVSAPPSAPAMRRGEKP